MNIKPRDIERFWSRVRRGPGCWEWTRGKSGGYGTIRIGGKDWKAHRFSYLLHYGAIRDCVLHHCDNPACVRPDHLFLGTHLDNMRDMAEKRRSSRLPGEANGNAKLNEVTAAQLKAVLRRGKKTQAEIAQQFGVSQQTVSNIATGKAWEWVEPTTTGKG